MKVFHGVGPSRHVNNKLEDWKESRGRWRSSVWVLTSSGRMLSRPDAHGSYSTSRACTVGKPKARGESGLRLRDEREGEMPEGSHVNSHAEARHQLHNTGSKHNKRAHQTN